MKHLVTGGYALTWCGLTSALPRELTGALELRTCKDCRSAMIARGVCPACGEKELSWGVVPHNKSGVVDGRLTLNDVETIFYLGCDHCSETLLAHVSPDVVAAALTLAGWRP